MVQGYVERIVYVRVTEVKLGKEGEVKGPDDKMRGCFCSEKKRR